ncbi:MAG: 50S ribosomal protein L21 [Chloroflexi bacterium]|nr:MAG: 50S ribosomal protein L21 [Chloroflexota bacterium]
MYAVVATGGKQYRVEPGTTLTVEKLSAEPGGSVVLDRVLLVGDGETLTIGTPLVDGASVSATVLEAALGPKLVIFKFKQKVKYRRRTGHRQHLTLLRVDEIRGADGAIARIEKADAPAATGRESRSRRGAARSEATPRRATATKRKLAAKPTADATAKPAGPKTPATKASAAKTSAAKTSEPASASADKPKRARTPRRTTPATKE